MFGLFNIFPLPLYIDFKKGRIPDNCFTSPKVDCPSQVKVSPQGYLNRAVASLSHEDHTHSVMICNSQSIILFFFLFFSGFYFISPKMCPPLFSISTKVLSFFAHCYKAFLFVASLNQILEKLLSSCQKF